MNDPVFDVWGIRGAAQALWFFGVIWIVLAAVLHYWAHANYGMTVASALLFPVTFFVYPWTHVALVPLWTVFLAASGLYLVGSIREPERVAPAQEWLLLWNRGDADAGVLNGDTLDRSGSADEVALSEVHALFAEQIERLLVADELGDRSLSETLRDLHDGAHDQLVGPTGL
jgi:hypothetical protein